MNRFLFGFAIGLGASAIAFVGIVEAYSPLVSTFPGFADALGYYLIGMVLAALAALIVAMIQVGMFVMFFPRHRTTAPAVKATEDDWS